MNLRPSYAHALALCFLAAIPASASIVYDNGPDALNNTYYTITGGFEVADSFTLSTGVFVDQVNLQLQVPVGDTPLSLDWLITTSEFGGATIASATGAALTGSLDHQWIFRGSPVGDVYQVSFTVPSVFLAAGTYWLQIQNATDANKQGTAWATGANNFGSAGQFTNPSITSIPSESFSIATPEPASFALIGAGIVALALSRRVLRLRAE